MSKFIKELRRRHVFRAVGIYITAAWILLQVANLVLPTYDAPEWIMRSLIILAVIGLPIAVVLSWMFDITEIGIQADAEVSDAVKFSKGRKTDFVIIGTLLAVLSVSLFLNLKPQEPIIIQDLEPLTVLVADFNNKTGDPVFAGTLEQVLTIGLEESSFINAFDRNSANRILATIDDKAKLDSAGARLVSVREGIATLVSGEVTEEGGKYEVSVFEINPEDGAYLAEFSEKVKSKTDVLAAVGELSRKFRKKLGDVSADNVIASEEAFTTVSLEAMHDYVQAQNLARDGKVDEALTYYQSAIEHDPQFGRAYTGLALSADKLGKIDEAEKAWAKALENLDGMTERERFGTMGIYYTVFNRNSEKAIENYEALIEKYPADSAGLNNLAVAYFMQLQFDKALEMGSQVAGIYPNKAGYRANYSLYAMYASDFETAKQEAQKTLDINPDYHFAYLPFAISALTAGDFEGAQTAYENMAATGASGASLANLGLADMLLAQGEAANAEQVLLKGIEADKTTGNKRAVASKKMMRAFAKSKLGNDKEEVTAIIEESLAESSGNSQLIPAALMYIDMDNAVKSQEIATTLNTKLDAHSRAYAKMLSAMLTLKSDEPGAAISAIDELNAAKDLADLWMVRYQLAKAYQIGGFHTEALAELQVCQDRIGEAYSLFLDDTPTYRYTASLDELRAKTKADLNGQFAKTQAP